MTRPRPTRQRFAALMYHNLSGCPDGDPSPSRYTVSMQSFREQLAWLRGEGYVAEGFGELEARLRSGDGLPERYALLTVDDGHRSNLAAAEAISSSGFKATFFVTTDACQNRDDFLDPPDIRQLLQAGHSVGTHGATHRGLQTMPRAQAAVELRQSRKWLEDAIAAPVRYLSLPHGGSSRGVVAECRAHGYVLVGNSVEWPNTWPLNGDPVLVRRSAVRRMYTLDTLAAILRCDRRHYARRRLRALALSLPKRILRVDRHGL